MLKMIVTDLDGTLLHAQERITERNLAALRQAIKRGVKLCVATGRNYATVQSLLQRYDLKAMGIYGNGAELIDEAGTLLAAHYFPKQHLKQVLDIFDREEIGFMIFTDQNHFYTTGDPQKVNYDFHVRCATAFHRDLAALLVDEALCVHAKQLTYRSYEELMTSDEELIKVEAFSLDPEKITRARQQLSQIADIAYLSSFDDNIEVTDVNAQKGLILKSYIQHVGISSKDVIVLGDGMNDISLFEHFPYSYAPSNATAGIKEKAYRVVSRHDAHDLEDAICDYTEEMIRKKQVFIFDMDGLLIDSERLHLKWWAEAFRQLQLDLPEDFMYDFIGSSGEEVRQLVAAKTGNPDFLREARKIRVACEHAYLKEHHIPLKEGAKELLTYLRAHNQRVILASSTARADVLCLLESAGLTGLISDMVCGDEIAYAKPHPEIYQKVLSTYHLDKDDCLVFEDSRNGLKAACCANIDVIGIPDVVSLADFTCEHLLGLYASLSDVLMILKNG